jgi:formate dehydrogenase maturation protein FdhE
VDAKRDPAAIPEVDELAALPLDLWAAEQGYRKLQSNLAGV